jgi:hypothetical protein
MRTIILTILVTASVAACSSDPRLAELENAQRQQAAQAAVAKSVVGAIPDWYVKPPIQEGVMYSAGSAMSLDLALATDKAVLDAKRGLADQLQSKLSSQTKQYVKEAGHVLVSANDYERTTSNLTTEIVVPRYVIEERVVLPEQAGFRAYVLLKYATTPSDLNNTLASTKAFQELSAKVEAVRMAAVAQSTENSTGSTTPSESRKAVPVIAAPLAVKDEDPAPIKADPRPVVKEENLSGE